jgi:hypothetical protein
MYIVVRYDAQAVRKRIREGTMIFNTSIAKVYTYITWYVLFHLLNTSNEDFNNQYSDTGITYQIKIKHYASTKNPMHVHIYI